VPEVEDVLTGSERPELRVGKEVGAKEHRVILVKGQMLRVKLLKKEKFVRRVNLHVMKCSVIVVQNTHR
jgi:hypothetical protein